jgi:hypothetical protein
LLYALIRHPSISPVTTVSRIASRFITGSVPG